MIGLLRAEDCTIAYMGASVTAQRDGYRPRLHELICRETGRDHRTVTAALGATGAITGVCTMDDLVVAHRPAIAFVEYATSDVVGTTPPAELVPVLEGIVGKLRDAGTEPCFLYLHRSDVDLPATDVVAAYEDVARRHGVASIDVGTRIRSDERTHLRDGVHTTDVGSAAVAGAIYAALAHLEAPEPAGSALDESYRHARVEPPPPGGVEGRFRLMFPYVELALGGTLRFTTTAELVGLLVVVGPHSGYIEVAYGTESADYLLWDEHCSYERLSSVILQPFVPAGANVTIRVVDRPVDRSAALRPAEPEAPRLKLAGLMVR